MKSATETREAARRVIACSGAVIKSAECTGTQPRLGVRRSRRARCRAPSGLSTMEASMVEITVSVEAVAVYESPAMREVGSVIVDDCTVAPIASPMMPSTSEASEADSEAHAKGDPRSGRIEPQIPIPFGPNYNWCSIHYPGIVNWDVNHLRFCGFNNNGFSLRRNFLLLIALQVPRLLRTSAHNLHRVHHIFGLVHIGFPKRGSPGKVVIHVGTHTRKLSECFHAGIPGLLVDLVGQIVSF